MTVATLAEPASQRALPNAAAWVEQALSGNAALLLGSISVAALGYALFTGRLPVRQALATVAGCVLLFGAPAIGRALRDLDGPKEAIQPSPTPMNGPNLPNVPRNEDPYAGAGLVK